MQSIEPKKIHKSSTYKDFMTSNSLDLTLRFEHDSLIHL